MKNDICSRACFYLSFLVTRMFRNFECVQVVCNAKPCMTMSSLAILCLLLSEFPFHCKSFQRKANSIFCLVIANTHKFVHECVYWPSLYLQQQWHMCIIQFNIHLLFTGLLSPSVSLSLSLCLDLRLSHSLLCYLFLPL